MDDSKLNSVPNVNIFTKNTQKFIEICGPNCVLGYKLNCSNAYNTCNIIIYYSNSCLFSVQTSMNKQS